MSLELPHSRAAKIMTAPLVPRTRVRSPALPRQPVAPLLRLRSQAPKQAAPRSPLPTNTTSTKPSLAFRSLVASSKCCCKVLWDVLALMFPSLDKNRPNHLPRFHLTLYATSDDSPLSIQRPLFLKDMQRAAVF